MDKKVCLIIMDGWGIGKKDKADIIYQAPTPFIDSLAQEHPHAQLLTDGENVGLPSGQMGNSEVGHQNIGAGRIVYQNLVRINKDIESGEFFKKQELVRAFSKAKNEDKPIHLLGLVSEGGVHSSQAHLHALLRMASDYGLTKVFVHVITDGRDTDPKSGVQYVRNLQEYMDKTTGQIASIIGRYYAMDRDQRWERIKKAYDLWVHAAGTKTSNASKALEESYQQGITDEFVLPHVVVDENHEPIALLQEDDIVICNNFRTDRFREITTALTQRDFPEMGMKKMKLYYVTMTNYDDQFQNIKIVYPKENVAHTLGEHLSSLGKTQIRIAETEKYPHVTFFFSGGREEEFEGEKRIMINSPKVATYDLQPEMSAQKVADAIGQEMDANQPDFICLNFANGDMVGHTGVIPAIEQACITVDKCVEQVVEKGLTHQYSFVIIADHGNADHALNDDGTPNTAHSLNPVPIYIIDPQTSEVKKGILADVAPTILTLMKLPIPSAMTGEVLVK